MITLDQAMTYKYTPNKTSQKATSTLKKPRNYPKSYNSPSDIVNIMDKMRESSKERKASIGQLRFETMLRKSGSTETILQNSLKQQLSARHTKSRSHSKESRHRSTSSKRQFKMSEFHSEVSK